MPVIASIILAAGDSSRLGYPKQAIEVKGKTLLHRTAEAVLKGCNGPVIVVLGSSAGAIGELLSPIDNPNLHVVENHDWKSGMGSSIACGMTALMRLDQQLDGVVVSLCDQPYLTQQVIHKLCTTAKAQPDRIIASAYDKTIGPPVLFPKQFFPQLEQCSGEKGARRILKENADRVETIEFSELAVDIDTQEDLLELGL